MIIEQPAIWLRWLYPRATWRMNKNERAVYLTFDDGISQNLEMKNASYLPQLEQALKDAGLTTEEIEKVFYKNVLRVYREILK